MREIRLAGPADLAALVELDTVAGRDAGRREAIAAWIAAGECLVALVDGRPVGYAALTQNFFHSPFIEMLMVATGARRTGVGAALLARCMISVPPGQKLWASTNESNRPMQALLAKAGFFPSGVVENLDPGDPELIFLWIAGEP